MNSRNGTRPPAIKYQRGAALFIALIMLVALTLVTLASLNTSLLQLRMSANEESRTFAFQSAQSAIDDVINIDYIARQPTTTDQTKQYFAITGSVGYTRCTPNWLGGGPCNTSTMTLTSPMDGTTSGPNQIKVTRLTDPTTTRSAKCPSAATFQIDGIYDRSTLGLGKSNLVQGYIACDYLGAPPPNTPTTDTSN